MSTFPLIFAEVKTQSPFGWRSDQSWDFLFEVANEIGDVLSIHTDPRWGGSFELLQRARSLTKKPLLAKGIHSTDEEVVRAVEFGAQYVLVVGRVPNVCTEHCLLEPLTIAELAQYDASKKVVWNSRDLATGGMKDASFRDARKIFSGWMCQASNLRTIKDVAPDAQAILVGTHLCSFADSVKNNGITLR